MSDNEQAGKAPKEPKQPKRATRHTHDEGKESRSLESLILTIRGQKVLLDVDLAAIYGVPTKALNQAVKRNAARFPEDFAFHLDHEDWATLNRSQTVTGSQKHRDPRVLPRVFTETGPAARPAQQNDPTKDQTQP